jgi:hypothetical protein
VLDVPQARESRGMRLSLSMTCLDHFGLADKGKMAAHGGMGGVITATCSADAVLTV